MNKNTYLNKLRNNLKSLPKAEVEDIVSDYEEHFEIGKNKGRKADEIAKALGDPKDLAKQFGAQYYVEKASKNKSATNIARAVFATVGLGFLNLIFVFGPFMAIVGIIIGIFAASLGISIAGLALIFSGIFPALLPVDPAGLSLVGVSLVGVSLASLGAILFIGSTYLTKGVYILLIKYLKFNIGIINAGASK